jgi:hypothetical protein
MKYFVLLAKKKIRSGVINFIVLKCAYSLYAGLDLACRPRRSRGAGADRSNPRNRSARRVVLTLASDRTVPIQASPSGATAHAAARGGDRVAPPARHAERRTRRGITCRHVAAMPRIKRHARARS